MNNKKMIIFSASLLFLSCVYLSWTEVKLADLNKNKNWWTLSFVNVKNSDPSFLIENHSNNTVFHWTALTVEKNKLSEGEMIIAKGASKKIDLNSLKLNSGEKIIIAVSDKDDKKEIYKNLVP